MYTIHISYTPNHSYLYFAYIVSLLNMLFLRFSIFPKKIYVLGSCHFPLPVLVSSLLPLSYDWKLSGHTNCQWAVFATKGFSCGTSCLPISCLFAQTLASARAINNPSSSIFSVCKFIFGFVTYVWYSLM